VQFDGKRFASIPTHVDEPCRIVRPDFWRERSNNNVRRYHRPDVFFKAKTVTLCDVQGLALPVILSFVVAVRVLLFPRDPVIALDDITMMHLPLRSIRMAVARFSPSSSYSYSLLSSDPSSEQPPEARPSLQSFGARLTGLLFFFLPSIIQRRLRPHSFKSGAIHPTSWLDGLRGVASLIVFFSHFTERNVPWFTHTYGIRDEDDPIASSPLQLPFVRNIYSGRPMVPIFFVVSGYVLSYKALKLLRSRDYDKLHRNLASSVFRRAFRLFLPTTASTFLVMWFIWAGWMGQPLPTLWEQLGDWLGAVWTILTVSWGWDEFHVVPYDVHLWTIPIEMSHSLLLFITLTGLSRLKTHLRLLAVLGIMIFCLKSGHWAPFVFLGGMAIAEIGMIQEARREMARVAAEERQRAYTDEGMEILKSSAEALAEFDESGMQVSAASILFQVFLAANLLFAMFVAGWPNNDGAQTPGIAALMANTMEPFHSQDSPLGMARPWFSIGAIQTVLALQQIRPLRNLFVTSFAQYLGNISYALYLCHGPLLSVLGPRVMPLVWGVVGGHAGAGVLGRLFVWFVGILALGTPLIWVSDVFWRSVDVGSVKAAKWLEGFCVLED
jgi:peptidoglycan/LPS O-acetylase OafA/YrhL